MMLRLALIGSVALGGCTWSNSLYHARRLSSQAVQLERDGRPFEAVTVWSRAAVKADTAYARDPEGEKGAEALWIRGRGRARSGDCPSAIGSLESALTAAPSATWREELQLELGQCLDRAGDARALQYFQQLESSADEVIRRLARLATGRSYVGTREWDKALTALAGIDTVPARLHRAIALAALNRGSEALAEVEPLLVARDTVQAWSDVVEAFAASDPRLSDSVISRLRATGSVAGPRMGALMLAAAQGSATRHPDYADRRLADVAAASDQGLSTQGRLMMAERLLARAGSPAALRASLDSVRSLATDDGATAMRFAALGRISESIVTQHDSVLAGAPLGDMLTFLQAELARDSLRSPELARFLFIRLERDWPTSPYAPKALLARMAAEPDSVDALRVRLLMHADSPYIAFLEGRQTERFTELETALHLFAQVRRPRNAVPSRPRQAIDSVPRGVDIP